MPPTRRSFPSLTLEGRITALLLLGFTAGAVNTGTNLLFALLGLLTSLFALEALRTRHALRGLSASRSLPRTAVRGQPVRATVRLTARGRRALPFLIEERDPQAALDRPARVLVWGVAPDAPAQATWEAAFVRRGLARLDGLRILCRGPCGLVESRCQLSAEDEVLVLPRLRRLRPLPLLAPTQPSEERVRAVPLGPERRDAVRSLRELRSGDDPRTIHWRATARRGQLMVREFERGAAEGALVLVDLWRPAGKSDSAAKDQAAEAATEAAVELALALLAEALRRGEPVGLGAAGEGTVALAPANGPATVGRAREALARIRAGERPDLARLLRQAERDGGEQRLFLVTTRDAGQARAAAPGLAAARAFEVHSPEEAEAWLFPPEEADERQDPEAALASLAAVAP